LISSYPEINFILKKTIDEILQIWRAKINCTHKLQKKKNIYIYHISCDKVQKLHHQDDEPNIFYIKVSNPRKCMMEAESKISQNLVASELRLVKAVEIGMIHSCFGRDSFSWIVLEHLLHYPTQHDISIPI